MLTRRRLLHTLPLAAGALWSCEQELPPPRYRLPKKPISVITTTVHAADLIRAVGGEAVEVASLIPPLANPHLWQPVAGDYARLQLADAFFLNGLGLESKFSADLDALRNQGLHIGVLAQGLEDSDILHRTDGKPDPHFWMDPRLWAKAATAAADVLSEAYPKAAAWFTDRAHEHGTILKEIFKQGEAACDALPPRSRCLFSTHDSMAYFGSAFRLQVRSLANSAGEAPLEVPAEISDWLTQNGVKTLFRENFSDLKIIRDLARPLHLMAEPQIFSLSLGLPGTILTGLARDLDVGSFAAALRYTLDSVNIRLAQQ